MTRARSFRMNLQINEWTTDHQTAQTWPLKSSTSSISEDLILQIIGRHFHLEHHDTGVNLTANRSGLRSTYEHNGPNAKAMDWTGVRAASTDERHWSSQRHKKALHFRSTRLASHNSATADSSGRLLHFTWDGRVRINGRCHGNHLAHFPPYGLFF